MVQEQNRMLRDVLHRAGGWGEGEGQGGSRESTVKYRQGRRMSVVDGTHGSDEELVWLVCGWNPRNLNNKEGGAYEQGIYRHSEKGSK